MADPGSVSKRATIVDVALAAHVSRQTVSNAVNAPERVAPQTLLRVSHEIRRLGYRPSLAARSLKLERANALGIELNPDGGRRMGVIQDSFVVELTIASRHHDSHLVPFAAEDHRNPLPAYEDLVASNLVDAFILANTRHDDPRPSWLRIKGLPFATFGRVWDEPDFTWWVDVDGACGVRDAVTHLIRRGYSRIGFLGWPSGTPVGDDRRSGWLEATRAAGIHRRTWQGETPGPISEATVDATRLIEKIGRGGAIVCASDEIALGTWLALRERGMIAGSDFGLVGFDDSQLADAFGITSLRQPIARIAENLLSILEGARLGGDLPTQGSVHRPTIVSRASTDLMAARSSLPRARNTRANTQQNGAST